MKMDLGQLCTFSRAFPVKVWNHRVLRGLHLRPSSLYLPLLRFSDTRGFCMCWAAWLAGVKLHRLFSIATSSTCTGNALGILCEKTAAYERRSIHAWLAHLRGDGRWKQEAGDLQADGRCRGKRPRTSSAAAWGPAAPPVLRLLSSREPAGNSCG